MLNAIRVATAQAAESPNPILPASYDLLWSSVCFAIILVFFWKVVLPKMQTLLDERAAAIEGNIAKADEAQAKAEAALQQYTEQLAGARQEAAQIRDAARADGTAIIAEAKETASTEAARIHAAAKAQIEAERQTALVSLRQEVGTLAIDLASGVVGERLSDDAHAAALVDRFLAELETAEQGAK